MWQAVIVELISPYREYLRLVREGKIDPEDIDVNVLISEFQDRIEELDYSRLFLLSGMFIEVVSRLIRFKTDFLTEVITPRLEDEGGERKKHVKRKIEEILKEYEMLEDESLAELFGSYRRKTGRRRGSRSLRIEQVCYAKFKRKNPFTPEGVLFGNTDYNAYASVIVEEIKKGTFSICSYKDFIGLMYAIYLFDIPVTSEDVKRFLRKGGRNV